MSNFLQPLSDLAALARAGFTAADIRECMAQDVKEPEAAKEVPETVPKEDTQPEVQTATEQPEPQGKEQPEPDYKLMFESQQAQLDRLKDDLIKAQTATINRNVQPESEQKSGQDLVNDIFRQVIY